MASPMGGKEHEPQAVAKPLKRMSNMVVAEGEEDIWVVHVAKLAVIESVVMQVVCEQGGPLVIDLTVSVGKRRTVDGASEADEYELGDGGMEVVVASGPKGGAPSGLRFNFYRAGIARVVLAIPGRQGGTGPGIDQIMQRRYRFVDRSLLGMSNRIIGDSYYTRGGSAHSPSGRGGRYGPYC